MPLEKRRREAQPLLIAFLSPEKVPDNKPDHEKLNHCTYATTQYVAQES